MWHQVYMLNSLLTVTKRILCLVPTVTNFYAVSINIGQFKTAVIWPTNITLTIKSSGKLA